MIQISEDSLRSLISCTWFWRTEYNELWKLLQNACTCRCICEHVQHIKDLLGFLFWDRLVILFSFNFTDQGLHVEQLPVFHWISRGTGVWDNNLTIGTFVAQKKTLIISKTDTTINILVFLFFSMYFYIVLFENKTNTYILTFQQAKNFNFCLIHWLIMQLYSTLSRMKRNSSKLTIIYHLMWNEKEPVKMTNYFPPYVEWKWTRQN